MRIVILQDYLRSGGTERQSILLGQGFAAAGHETTLVTFRPGGPLSPTGKSLERQALQSFDLGLDWFAPGLRGTVRELAPAIVLAMGRMANCHAGPLQRLLDRRKPRGAVVGTMRTGKPLPWLFRRSLHAERHIIANSEEARAILVGREGLPPEKITVIHNSLVFPPRAVAPASELRSRMGAGPGTTVLLCVAMFRPEKNQRELVEIVAGLPGAGSAAGDWQLWLAGDGPARAACASLARERGLADRVKFPGFFPDPGELYAAADFAVHASRSESLSNFLIEAQAHGLPVVAYAAQGIGECFLSGQTGWAIPAGDRAAFRAALSALFAEPRPARAARSEAASQFARLQFDPDRQMRAHLDLFARLVP
jgi:glycosyltransferase involved in cell wall biosynthesis